MCFIRRIDSWIIMQFKCLLNPNMIILFIIKLHDIQLLRLISKILFILHDLTNIPSQWKKWCRYVIYWGIETCIFSRLKCIQMVFIYHVPLRPVALKQRMKKNSLIKWRFSHIKNRSCGIGLLQRLVVHTCIYSIYIVSYGYHFPNKGV